MTEKRKEALRLISHMGGADIAAEFTSANASDEFCNEMGKLALNNVFESLWTRAGLNPRDRSLVTLGILIALRARDELEFHVPAAVRNGLSIAELEEVIYHASGYAGFPAAASARMVSAKALASAGLLPRKVGQADGF